MKPLLCAFKRSLFFLSIKSTAKCLAWSRAWWAALPGYTLRPSLPDGQMCRQPTAVTPAHLCIHPATPPPGTCTPPSARAGTQSTNTRSISPASPTSTGRPPRAGPNKPPHPWMQRLPNTLNHKKIGKKRKKNHKEEQSGGYHPDQVGGIISVDNGCGVFLFSSLFLFANV